MLPFTQEDIARFKAQGWSDSDIQGATLAPSQGGSNGANSPISSTLKAHAGGILGGGAGAIGGTLAAASLLGAPETGGLSLVGLAVPAILGALGGVGGSYLGQKGQQAIESPATYSSQQQAAGQAEQAHPIVSALTDILASGVASGGLPNPAAGIRGIGNLLGRIGGRELSHEGANVAMNSLVNPAINTGIGLATGQGVPSLGNLALQAGSGALFGSSWLGGRGRPSPIEESEPEINEKDGTGIVGQTEPSDLDDARVKGFLNTEHRDVTPTTATKNAITDMEMHGLPISIQKDDGSTTDATIGDKDANGVHTIIDEKTGKELVLSPEEQSQFKQWIQATKDTNANTEQKPMEMVRNEQTRPTTQVAKGKSSELQPLAGKQDQKSSGLTEEQNKNLKDITPEEEAELRGMKLNAPPVKEEEHIPYGFWVSPEGKMIPVGAGSNEEGHDIVANRLLKEHYGIKVDAPGSFMSSYGLLNKGWTRIVKPFGQNLLMAESGPSSRAITSKQRSAIHDYAVEHNIGAYHLPGGNGREEWIHEPSQLKSNPNGSPNHIPNTNGLTNHILNNKANVGTWLHGIANTSWHPLSRIAGHLLSIADEKGKNVRILPGAKEGDTSHYSMDKDEIRIHKGDIGNARVILHEILHSLTSRKLPTFRKIGKAHLDELEHYLKTGKNEAVKGLIKSYIETAKATGRYNRLFENIGNFDVEPGNTAKYNYYQNRLPYGMGNLHEFIAEAFSNKQFQELLNNTPSNDGKTIWQKVVDSIKELLGLDAKDGSMLESVIRSSSELVHQDRPTDVSHYKPYQVNAPPKSRDELPPDRYMGKVGKTTRATIDKLHDVGTKPAHVIADAAKIALNKKDELVGKWKNPVVQAGKDLSKFDRDKLNQVFQKEKINNTSFRHMLTNQKQRNYYNTFRQKYDESGQYHIDIGEPIKELIHTGNKTFYATRQMKQKQFGYPQMANHGIMNDYRSGKNIEAHDKVLDEFNQNQLHMTPQQSQERIDNFKKSLMQDPSAHNVTSQDYFNAFRKEAGTPLPESFVEQNPVRNAEIYFDRAAMDASHYEHMEKSPEVLAALGQTKDAWGKEVPQIYGNGISGMPEVRNVTNQWIGEKRNPAQEVEGKFSSLLSSVFISSPALEAHKIGSNLVGAWSISNPLVFTKALGHAIMNINDGYKKAVAGNVMKMSAVQSGKMFDSTATAAERMQALGRGIRQIATLGDLTTKFNASLMQNMSEVILRSKIERANDGCITCQKFLKNLDPSYLKGKDYSPEQLTQLASTSANYLHGTGDIRSLPAWMLNDSEFSGFFSLAHWSIAKTNMFMKDIWEPATRGDIKPLLTGAFGAAIGGYLIKELRQDIQGKKNPIPSLSEIASSDRGLQGNTGLLMYNTIAAFQYAGFGGLLSQVAKYPFDMVYKNNPQGATFPMDEVVSDIASTIHQVGEALANDPSASYADLITAVSNHILSTDIQLSRIALNQGINNGLITGVPAEKKELSDKLGQLRRFDMAENLPYNDIDQSQNPYMNLEQKSFKLNPNPEQAVQQIPDLIQGIIARYHNNPDVLREKLQGLKENEYATFPDMENMPLSFFKYLGYLNREQGPEQAQAALQDYVTHKAVNEAKSSVVP